jgi:hypothetical protein
MEGVCSAQVQAQNKHSRARKAHGSAIILQAAFADTNIAKDRHVYSIVKFGRVVVSPLQAAGGGVVTFSALVKACPATLAPLR